MPGDLIPYDESGGWDGFVAMLVPLAFRQEIDRIARAINEVGVAVAQAFGDAARGATESIVALTESLRPLVAEWLIASRRRDITRRRKRLRARAKAGRGRGR